MTVVRNRCCDIAQAAKDYVEKVVVLYQPSCGNRHCRLPECLDGSERRLYGRAHREALRKFVKAVDPDLLPTFEGVGGDELT